MGRTSLLCIGAPPTSWTEFSKAQSPLICPWNKPRSSTWSQSQNREGDRVDDPGFNSCPCQRRDRIGRRFAGSAGSPVLATFQYRKRIIELRYAGDSCQQHGRCHGRNEPMRRRDFIKVVSSGILTWPLAARGQQSGKTWRVGFIAHRYESFYDGL